MKKHRLIAALFIALWFAPSFPAAVAEEETPPEGTGWRVVGLGPSMWLFLGYPLTQDMVFFCETKLIHAMAHRLMTPKDSIDRATKRCSKEPMPEKPEPSSLKERGMQT